MKNCQLSQLQEIKPQVYLRVLNNCQLSQLQEIKPQVYLRVLNQNLDNIIKEMQ